MFNKKAFLKLIFFALGLFFIWSCEDSAEDKDPERISEITIKSQLNDAKTRYTFYVDTLIHDDSVLYDPGRISDGDDDTIGANWGRVMLRWGFRKRTLKDDGKIYWVQTTQGDQDTLNVYETKVKEERKAFFTPEDLPEALLNEDDIEIYVIAEIGGQRLTGFAALPDDFKEKVLGTSVVEGQVFNATARDEGRSGSKSVEGAAVFFVHSSTGRIFQTHTNKEGRFRGTVQYKNEFYLVVLRQGFVPYIKTIAIPEHSENNFVSLKETDKVKLNDLYELDKEGFREVTDGAGYHIDGIAVDTDQSGATAGKGLAQTFLLLYDRDFANGKQKVYFLQSNDNGSFSFDMPLPASIGESERTTVSVAAAAYGYSPDQSSERIGEERTANEIFGTIGFERNAAFDTLPVLDWAEGSTGGPHNFAYVVDENGDEQPITLRGTSPITVNLNLKAEGLFLSDPLSVVWRRDGIIDSSKTGLTASFDLDAKTTISAELTDIRKNKVTLTRVFDLSSSSGIGPNDPIVRFGVGSIQGGAITQTSINSNGISVLNVAADASEVYLLPDVEAINPSGGDITYKWTLTDANNRTQERYGLKPLNLRLWAGSNNVELEVSSGGYTTTINKIYIVGSIS